MAEWTRSEPNYDLIPNLYVQEVLKDGVFQHYVIYPCSGYVLHVPSGDIFLYDDEGNIVLDEEGNAVVEIPCYTWGGATEFAGYDWAANPHGYEAVLYEEGMTIFGDVKPPHEIM
jgi:hypothetical protein